VTDEVQVEDRLVQLDAEHLDEGLVVGGLTQDVEVSQQRLPVGGQREDALARLHELHLREPELQAVPAGGQPVEADVEVRAVALALESRILGGLIDRVRIRPHLAPAGQVHVHDRGNLRVPHGDGN
jgi:hypothetical protein